MKYWGGLFRRYITWNIRKECSATEAKNNLSKKLEKKKVEPEKLVSGVDARKKKRVEKAVSSERAYRAENKVQTITGHCFLICLVVLGKRLIHCACVGIRWAAFSCDNTLCREFL